MTHVAWLGIFMLFLENGYSWKKDQNLCQGNKKLQGNNVWYESNFLSAVPLTSSFLWLSFSSPRVDSSLLQQRYILYKHSTVAIW